MEFKRIQPKEEKRHISYDPVTREHFENGKLIDTATTETQRAESFSMREDEWERFCVSHGSRPGMKEVKKQCEARVLKQLTEEGVI